MNKVRILMNREGEKSVIFSYTNRMTATMYKLSHLLYVFFIFFLNDYLHKFFVLVHALSLSLPLVPLHIYVDITLIEQHLSYPCEYI